MEIDGCEKCKDTPGWVDSAAGMKRCECFERKIKLAKAQKLVDQSGLRGSLLKKSFDNYHPKTKQQKDALEKVKKGGSFFLIGDWGVGKCVAGGTLILSSRGIIPIEEIAPHQSGITREEVVEIDDELDVSSSFKRNKASHFYAGGLRETVILETRYGYRIEGTFNHPVMTASLDGIKWKMLSDVLVSDYVAISRCDDLWASMDMVDKDEAYLMGLIVGDGHYASAHRVEFVSADKMLIEAFRGMSWKCWGKLVSEDKDGRDNLQRGYFDGKVLRDYLRDRGLFDVRSEDKSIPFSVMRSSKSVVVSFLQGLFDTDGSSDLRGYVELTSKSDLLIRQVQVVLANLGIISSRGERKVNDAWYSRLTISGDDVRQFYRKVGFRLARKQERERCLPIDRNPNVGSIPFGGDLMKELLRLTGPHTRAVYGRWRNYLYGGWLPSRKKVIEFIEQVGQDARVLESLNKLSLMSSANIFWDTVERVSFGRRCVYDLVVPRDHAFVGNCFVNHNTHLLAASVNEAVKNGVGAVFFSVPWLLQKIRDDLFSNRPIGVMDVVSDVEYLALDDLGKEKATDMVQEKLFMILDRREIDGLRTSVTSNYDPETLRRDKVDGAIVSRIVGMCDVIVLEGDDYRFHGRKK
jgi:intein/homing endonuclease